MSLLTLKRAVVLVVVLLLLPVGLYWLADAWLESSGGRQMLEQELGARFGMSVSLEGEFDLMLLPDIGVSGTELVIGGEAGPGRFFCEQSRVRSVRCVETPVPSPGRGGMDPLDRWPGLSRPLFAIRRPYRADGHATSGDPGIGPARF